MNNKKTPSTPSRDAHFEREIDETLTALEQAHDVEHDTEPKHASNRAADKMHERANQAEKRSLSLIDDDEAPQTQHSAKDNAYQAHVSAQKKKNPFLALGIAVGILAVTFISMTIFSIVMYQKYSPERFIEEVI